MSNHLRNSLPRSSGIVVHSSQTSTGCSSVSPTCQIQTDMSLLSKRCNSRQLSCPIQTGNLTTHTLCIHKSRCLSERSPPRSSRRGCHQAWSSRCLHHTKCKWTKLSNQQMLSMYLLSIMCRMLSIFLVHPPLNTFLASRGRMYCFPPLSKSHLYK